MKRINAIGIVLARTNFGEADRIITFLTPDQGKIKGMVRGVRKQKSKMAGGVELFSVSDITYIVGKGEINTVISTRLIKHYGSIVKNLDRTNAGYEFIKLVNKSTEDNPERTYFDLLHNAFEALDDDKIDLELVALWFTAQLLRLAGRTPNLATDGDGNKLQSAKSYHFDFDSMNFYENGNDDHSFKTNHIKLLRLSFSDNLPKTLQKVEGAGKLASYVRPLTHAMLQTQTNI